MNANTLKNLPQPTNNISFAAKSFESSAKFSSDSEANVFILVLIKYNILYIDIDRF